MRNPIFILIMLFTSLATWGQTATEIAKTGIKSTVSIIALDKYMQPLGYGSGFILDNGLVATNIHVVRGCSSAYILKNGESTKHKVEGFVGIDLSNDLIVLKSSTLTGSSIQLGSNALPDIGQKIYAVGSPKGLRGTFSEGIVSGIRESGSNKIIQITAPISPGSSGGPVLNTSGQAIGVAFASYSGGQNLNFAIPISYLKTLKNNPTSVKQLSSFAAKATTTTTSTAKGDIKEGVVIRNVDWSPGGMGGEIFYSIKNNLSFSIKNVKMIFIIYDKTGTVVDYDEVRYGGFIKPFLAKSFTVRTGWLPEVSLLNAAKIETRILDYEIIEE